jgi:hypothetical protein
MALYALRHKPTGDFLQIVTKTEVSGVPESGSGSDVRLAITGGVEVGHWFRHVFLVVDNREILETLIKDGFAGDHKFTPMTLNLESGAPFSQRWTADQLEIVPLTPEIPPLA